MRTEAATLPKCASARVPGIVVAMVVGAQHDERGGERAARITEDDSMRMSASLVFLVALRLWLSTLCRTKAFWYRNMIGASNSRPPRPDATVPWSAANARTQALLTLLQSRSLVIR